jgi:hypothetical protein
MNSIFPKKLTYCQRKVTAKLTMSVNLFLHRYTVHVPSIARARVLPTIFLRRPMIYINCHNGHDMTIPYPIGSWDQAKKDFEALQLQMHRCQKALSTVSPPVNVDSESDSNSDSDLK